MHLLLHVDTSSLAIKKQTDYHWLFRLWLLSSISTTYVNSHILIISKITNGTRKRQNTKLYITHDCILEYIYVCVKNDQQEIWTVELSVDGFCSSDFLCLY